MQAIETFNFSHNGMEWVARVYPDDTQGNPWEEFDGHGECMEISDREPVPRGWTVIHDMHRGRWIYNTGAAIVKARRERWGITSDSRYFQPGMSRAAKTYAAVKEDRDNLAAYLRGDWHYVGVSVQPANTDEPDDFRAACWGIESNAGDYLQEVAQDLSTEWKPTQQAMHLG